jgi:hypothetical protein
MAPPRFTAEASLYRTGGHYYSRAGTVSQASGAIGPAWDAADCYYRCYRSCMSCPEGHHCPLARDCRLECLNRCGWPSCGPCDPNTRTQSCCTEDACTTARPCNPAPDPTVPVMPPRPEPPYTGPEYCCQLVRAGAAGGPPGETVQCRTHRRRYLWAWSLCVTEALGGAGAYWATMSDGPCTEIPECIGKIV